MSANETSIAIARAAAHAASDKIGQDIVAIDVSERLAITDVFLVASASSERQVNSIVDGIEEELAKRDLKPVRREGRSEGRWVLLDYLDVVIHVQHEEDRVFYALERLWGDCPVIDLQLEDAPAASTSSAPAPAPALANDATAPDATAPDAG